jgi:hypothetical protein
MQDARCGGKGRIERAGCHCSLSRWWCFHLQCRSFRMAVVTAADMIYASHQRYPKCGTKCRVGEMKRRMRNIMKIFTAGAVIVSSLLCTASLFLMVRTHFVSDEINVYRTSTQWVGSLLASSGRVYIVEQFAPSLPRPASPIGWSYVTYAADVNVDRSEQPNDRFGFRWGSWESGGPSGMTIRFAGVPLWFLVILFGAAPALRIIRRRKYPEGRCRNCGYDLRATPERCPECGRIPKLT